MNAIIYAAGRALRLGPLYKDRTKVMLEFGGKSLLERHVEHLARLGSERAWIVTGHLREQIASALPPLQKRYGVRLEELHNPDYAEGSALSMAVSLPVLRQTTGAVLLMDGDVLYDGRMLQRLLASPQRTALLVDFAYSTADDDPVLVPIRGGRPFDFVKKWKGAADRVGESIGFFKLDAADLPLLIRETEARTTGAGRKDSYDDILRALAQAGRFGFEDVTGLSWNEIDFPQDVEYAAKVVLPALERG